MSEVPKFARDMDLVRDILIWAEQGAPRQTQPCADNQRRFGYHCKLMKEAGFIDASIIEFPADDGITIVHDAYVYDLRWAGHEALAAIRSATVWEKTKHEISARGLPLLLDLAVSVAKGYAAKSGLPLG